MTRTRFPLFVLVLLLAVALPAAALAQDEEPSLFRVEIHNRSASPVTLVLFEQQSPTVYALTVQAGAQRTFTLREGVYDQTTYACGDSAEGSLDVSQQLRLVFTACPSEAPNWGAPTLEKIHLVDAPHGKLWRYQYTPLAPPASVPPPVFTGSCEFTPTGEVTIYRLPDFASSVFFTVGAGEFGEWSRPNARTADGWIGFDPGYAQAGNIGPFHNRWIPPDAPGTLSSGCANLPVQWGPMAGVCYATVFETTNIYAAPDASSAIAGRLHREDFAAVLGNTAARHWTQVDLQPGNTGEAVTGWMAHSQLYFQSSCGSIPTISP
jgi:hypothetical protein